MKLCNPAEELWVSIVKNINNLNIVFNLTPGIKNLLLKVVCSRNIVSIIQVLIVKYLLHL